MFRFVFNMQNNFVSITSHTEFLLVQAGHREVGMALGYFFLNIFQPSKCFLIITY